MVHVYDVLVVGWTEDRDFVLLSFVVARSSIYLKLFYPIYLMSLINLA